MKKFDPTAAAAPRRSTSADRPRVLYVEDEDANWRVSAKVLSEHYDLERARDARECIAALRATPYRAILMDIQLADSDLNGIELVRLIRGDPELRRPPYALDFAMVKVPPIIFVTAYTARYTKDELVRVGGDDVINKPVDLTKLHLAITRCIMQAATASLERAKTTRTSA